MKKRGSRTRFQLKQVANAATPATRLRRVPAAKPQWSQLARKLWSWTTVVGGAVGFVAGLILSAAGGLAPLLPGVPEFSTLSGDRTNPFSLPFSVQNPSYLFAMQDIRIACLFEHMVYGEIRLENVPINGPAFKSIPAGESRNFYCDFQSGGGSYTDLRIRIVQYFTTPLVGKRETISPLFTWTKTAEGGSWVKGDIEPMSQDFVPR